MVMDSRNGAGSRATSVLVFVPVTAASLFTCCQEELCDFRVSPGYG